MTSCKPHSHLSFTSHYYHPQNFLIHSSSSPNRSHHHQTMNSIIQSIREKNLIPGFSSTLSLPLSQSTTDVGQSPQGLRRRLSSLPRRIQQQVPSPGASWSSFRHAKSVSSMGDYHTGTTSIRKLWEQGWLWIMSRKPTLARDLEMSEEEGRVLGVQNKGSLRHVLFKFRSEFLKLVGSDTNVSLPR